jgi:PAS domain S-box-containing protein
MPSQALPAPAKHLFRYLFEQASLGIAVEDLDGKLLLANPALCSMLGYTEKELCGMSCSQFASPEDSQDDWALFQQLRAGVIDQYSLEKRYVRKDGAPLWGHLNVSLLKEGDGGSPLVFAFVEEITGRKLAEQELARSHERFRLAMQAGKSVGWEWDIKSGRDSWFGDLRTMFGIPSDTFVGRVEDFYGYVHPEDRQMVAKEVSDARQSRNPYAAEFRVVRLDGTVRWVSATGQFYYDSNGDAERMVGLAADITERKRVDEALRESEERFRLAAQAGRMFAYEWDATTDVIVRSAEVAQILGIDEAAQITGQQMLAKVHPDDRERFLAAVAALSAEKPYLQVSFRMGRPDGSVIWVERNSRADFDEQGRLLRMVGMVADITERKRAEEALKRSESNYRLFVAQSSEGIFCQELERPIPVDLPEDEQVQRILHESYMAECNDAFARMYGMPPADFVGKRLTETLDAENPINIELTRDYIRGGYRVVDRESYEVDPQGNPRVFLNSMIGIVENNMLLRTWGIQRDLTDRRQAEQARVHAEQALRESEQRFRLATQAGKMYAYEWDVGSDMVVRSEEYVNVLGFGDQPKQLTRQQLLARVHPDDRVLFVGSVDQLTPQCPITQITYRVLRPEGSVVWLEKSARAFFDEQGRMLRVIGMVADITDRKRTEEALRESEDKLRLLLDSTAEAIYGIDLEGRCTFCNPACLRALGYERVDELLGKNMHDLIHRLRADGSLFPVEESRIFRAFRAGEGVHADDEVLWRRDGTSFPAEYWSYPQRRGQEVVGAVVAFIDITQRKLGEAALANASRRLIQAREQERIRIARELHDDFAQRLALLASDLLQLYEDPPDLPEVRRRVGELHNQTTEIVSDIQTLSHELHSARLQYLGIAGATRGFCQEFGEQANMKIDFKSHDLPGPLSPDISLCLFRVLQEALHNSAKHSGVRHVEVQLWATSDEVHLTVSDGGAGFDSKSAERNQGLGLISMEERLKLVKGTLSIESQPKRGTTIHACVPLVSGSDSMRAAG